MTPIMQGSTEYIVISALIKDFEKDNKNKDFVKSFKITSSDLMGYTAEIIIKYDSKYFFCRYYKYFLDLFDINIKEISEVQPKQITITEYI